MKRIALSILISAILGTILFVTVKSRTQTFDAGYATGVFIMAVSNTLLYYAFNKKKV
jgi:hypothetical protein